MKAPLLKILGVLVVTLPESMNDQVAQELQQAVLQEVEQTSVRGVIFNASQLDLVDSYLARLLSDTARMVQLMGVETILAGLQPLVVLTMVEMGLEMKEIPCALDLARALELLAPKEG